jgi:glutamate racemase
LPAQLLVALAEEGLVEGPVAQGVISHYLAPLFALPSPPDTLVLGCTHFPVLTPTIREVLGPQVRIVDSARTTAQAACELLDREGLRRVAGTGSTLQFLATDGVARFARVGARFLGRSLAATDVDLIDF